MCLVAKDFTQFEGLIYHDTFPLVAKLMTLCFLLAVATVRHWELHQININNTFLYGNLYEEVYMKILLGFVKFGDNRVC